MSVLKVSITWLSRLTGLWCLPINGAAFALVNLSTVVRKRIFRVRQAVQEIGLFQDTVGEEIVLLEVEFDVELDHRFVIEPGSYIGQILQWENRVVIEI